MEHNQDRRRHFHRGRRGQDRRGVERRSPQPQAQDQPPREGREGRATVDVEQIMRDIRARIGRQHGIELSNQQIQELAARRLEAILDPRAIKPALLDELRRSAGIAAAPPPATTGEPAYTFTEATLYESHNPLIRFFRALFRPLLKLLFNPAPVARALEIQSTLNSEAAQRERARSRQQAEWNALHYEILQRLVTEVSRASIETQALSLKVESLAAKVDFNERRVRSVEGAVHQPRSSGRAVEPQAAAAAIPTFDSSAVAEPAPAEGLAPLAQPAATGQPTDGQRRRRRRRRGRRGGSQQMDAATGIAPGGLGEDADEGTDEGADDENGSESMDVAAEAVPGVVAESAPVVVAESAPAVVAESAPAVVAESAPVVIAESAPVQAAPPLEPVDVTTAPTPEAEPARTPAAIPSEAPDRGPAGQE
jgi:hypothetical protein